MDIAPKSTVTLAKLVDKFQLVPESCQGDITYFLNFCIRRSTLLMLTQISLGKLIFSKLHKSSQYLTYQVKPQSTQCQCMIY